MDTAYHRRAIRTLAGMVIGILVLGWLPATAAAIPPLDAAAGARLAGVPAMATSPPWAWPLAPTPRVVRHFDKPPGPYAAGHRGVDLAGVPGQDVLAVDAGVVTHAALLAGRGTVTIEHPGGVRSTYEPLRIDPLIRRNSSVATGQALGTLDSTGSHCAPLACLHLGALRQGSSGEWDYVQPLFLLQPMEVILLPSP